MNTPLLFEPASALTVCIDFKSPQGWLAVHPTFALEDALGIAADWLPVVLRAPRPPRTAEADDDRGTRHRAIRAYYYERDLQRYAALRGLSLGNASRADDSRLAGMGLLWSKRSGHAAARRYIEVVYSRYFTSGEPIALGELPTIEQCISAAGIASSGFAEFVQAEQSDFDALQRALQEAGLHDSPAYMVERDVFYGRAHLPMLHWLLADQRGMPPI